MALRTGSDGLWSEVVLFVFETDFESPDAGVCARVRCCLRGYAASAKCSMQRGVAGCALRSGWTILDLSAAR